MSKEDDIRGSASAGEDRLKDETVAEETEKSGMRGRRMSQRRKVMAPMLRKATTMEKIILR